MNDGFASRVARGLKGGCRMTPGRASDDRVRLEEENKRLRAAVEELSILNDISTAINSSMSLEEIIELIVRKCIEHLRVEQGTVTLIDDPDAGRPFRTMIRRADVSNIAHPYHLDTQITGWMLVNRKPLVVDDLEADERFRTTGGDENPVRSLLSVPLLLHGRVLGSLNVFNKRGGVFDDDDKRLLSIIATQSAQTLENARLNTEEQALKGIREEMRLASQIQRNLLPECPPEIDGWDIAGCSIPARDIGGDYFDFIDLGDGRTAICMGDVSGKGLPAAILMSNLQATMRGQALERLSPAETLARSNRLMYRCTAPERFSTFFFGILDHETGALLYASAGHDYPILVTGGEIRRLCTGGLILGAIEDTSYENDRVDLSPGDVLVVFTDGITEALDPDDRQFSDARLEKVVVANAGSTAGTLIDRVIAEVRSFTRGREQSDDTTILVIARRA